MVDFFTMQSCMLLKKNNPLYLIYIYIRIFVVILYEIKI